MLTILAVVATVFLVLVVGTLIVGAFILWAEMCAGIWYELGRWWREGRYEQQCRQARLELKQRKPEPGAGSPTVLPKASDRVQKILDKIKRDYP